LRTSALTSEWLTPLQPFSPRLLARFLGHSGHIGDCRGLSAWLAMPEPRRCLAFLSRSSACRSSLPSPLDSKRSNDHENADLLTLSSVWVSRPLGSSCPFCCSSSRPSPFAACSSLFLQLCWSPDEVGLKSSGRLANVSSSRRPTRLLYLLFISLRNSWDIQPYCRKLKWLASRHLIFSSVK
jgi:hypothetical protein